MRGLCCVVRGKLVGVNETCGHSSSGSVEWECGDKSGVIRLFSLRGFQPYSPLHICAITGLQIWCSLLLL